MKIYVQNANCWHTFCKRDGRISCLKAMNNFYSISQFIGLREKRLK